MISPTKYPDYHYVPPEHKVIDARLENWADFVRVKFPSWVGPIWKLGKSNGRQWEVPQFRKSCDTLDGQKMEEAVRKLPPLERSAIRWAYVFRSGQLGFRRRHRLTEDKLAQLLHDGRAKLMRI